MKRVATRRPAMPGIALCTAFLLLGGCRDEPPRALGTLEWDRVTLPAPAAERIVAIDVREGQRVRRGDPLLRLEPTRTRSQFAAAQAQAQQSLAALAELEAGPRSEEIARARAALIAAQAQADEARAYYARLRPLGQQKLVSTADVDRARAAAANTQAQARSAREAVLELERGTRAERVAQGESAARAAAAQASVQQETLAKLTLVAPRDGVVDSVPYRLGDQAPVGAPLVVLLAGDAPYARVYVPQRLRARIKVGDDARVRLEGDDRTYAGKVRTIRSEPSFTPYYALTGQDAERLSYLAEIQLEATARALPAGLPLSAEFDAVAAPAGK